MDILTLMLLSFLAGLAAGWLLRADFDSHARDARARARARSWHV